MADDQPSLSREDYAAIEAAVMETSRGRWFLAEYARRNRQADTVVLLEALQRIEGSVRQAQQGGAEGARLRADLFDVGEALARAKRDLATSVADSVGAGQAPSVERAFEDMVRVAERADADVFAIAEHVQEVAWSLRESGDVVQACADLERQALELYRASNQHALTTNRIRALVGVLRLLESRLGLAGTAWTLDPDRGEPRHGMSTAERRSLVDAAPPRIRDDIVFIEPRIGGDQRDRQARRAAVAPPPQPAPPVQPVTALPSHRDAPEDPRHRAFAAIDALGAEQKLALFA
jgi:hypothetical protein